MSVPSVSNRTPGFRFVFPPPAYCAYTGGAIAVPSTDTTPATPTNAYAPAIHIPVNAPPSTPVHVEDSVPQNREFVSPYPSSNYRVLPASTPIHVEDKEPKSSRSRRS